MTSVTFQEFRKEIIAWAGNITGRVIKLANAGEGPESQNPYVVVYVTTSVNPSHQDSFLSQDGLTETVIAPTKLDVQLDIYGGDTMQDASRLIRSLQSAERWLDLWKICGLENVLDLRDLTLLETGVRKQRAQVVIRFSANLESTFTSDFFDKLRMDVIRSDGVVAATDLKGEEDPHKEADICSIP